MALSLALILLLGLTFNKLFESLKLPGLLGMLLLGILIGPYGINWISEDILRVSGDLRGIALIIILLRAGLGLDREILNQVGIPAAKMSVIPVLFEGAALVFAASWILNISRTEAGILAFILAAVSPAVIVPGMLALREQGIGRAKAIPTLILAGASVDDVLAITFFSAFLGLYVGSGVSWVRQILGIPLGILTGVILGIFAGFALISLFKRFPMRDTKKVLILLGIGILMTSLEDSLAGVLPLASLLGVMALGFVLLEWAPAIAHRISGKLNRVWVLAELLLFVLVGAEVNILLAWDAGFIGLVLIAAGLAARSLGVLVSVAGTGFNPREKAFCVIAYLPKATVQAAIGAVPLAAGVPSGELFLALAVLSIVVTAPLGAIGIRLTGRRFLDGPES